MAEGLLQHLCGKGFEGFSAGIIKTHVHPLAIKVMDEIGVDISKHVSKTIDEFRDEVFDYVVTVCDNAKETCPFFPGKNVIHKGFEDPSQQLGSSKEAIEAFRMVRDEIKEFIVETFCNIQ